MSALVPLVRKVPLTPEARQRRLERLIRHMAEGQGITEAEAARMLADALTKPLTQRDTRPTAEETR